MKLAMSFRPLARFALLPLLALLALPVACGDDTPGAPPVNAGAGGAGASSAGAGGAAAGAAGAAGSAPGTQPASIVFAAKAGAEAFSCTGQLTNIGTSKRTIEPLDFRFYVHGLRLVRADGSEAPVTLTEDQTFQHDGLALLDFEDGAGTCENGTTATNDRVVGTVASGSYARVRFELGVPEASNHADAALAPSPLNITSLFWNWNGGYKFARLDARVVDENAPSGGALSFVFHLGSTSCVGDAAKGGAVTCKNLNLPTIDLALPAPAGGDLGTKTIVFDWANLLADVDVAKDEGGVGGCMSGATDPECGKIFSRLGLDAGGGATGSQSAFRIE